MGVHCAYVLKGYGRIEPAWVQMLLALFKREKINIRRLILLQGAHPTCFSMLEVHFALPDGEARAFFMEKFEKHLALQAWETQSLESLAPLEERAF